MTAALKQQNFNWDFEWLEQVAVAVVVTVLNVVDVVVTVPVAKRGSSQAAKRQQTQRRLAES